MCNIIVLFLFFSTRPKLIILGNSYKRSHNVNKYCFCTLNTILNGIKRSLPTRYNLKNLVIKYQNNS